MRVGIRKLVLAQALAVVFCTAMTVAAHANPVAEFNAAYRAYDAAHEEGRYEDAIPHAQRALELGETLLADKPDQLAMLTYNLGYTYQLSGRFDDAIDAYKDARDRYEAVFGERSMELVEILDALASTYVAKSDAAPWGEKRSPMVKARWTLKRLLKVYEDNFGADDLRLAPALIRLGDVESNLGEWTDATGHFERTISLVESASVEGDIIHADALIGLGRVNAMRKRGEKAIPYLEKAIALLQAADGSPRHLLVGANTLLVMTYEALGDRDKATPHAQAIAMLGSTEGEASLRPIVRVPPPYPRSAQERGQAGMVIFGFDVDAAGMVTNAKVLAANPEGVFDEAGLDTLNRFRFAPAIVNGKFARTTGQTIRLVWQLEGFPVPEIESEPSEVVTTTAKERRELVQ